MNKIDDLINHFVGIVESSNVFPHAVFMVGSIIILLLIYHQLSTFLCGYKRRDKILTKTEIASFKRIEPMVNSFNGKLFAQVRVADVINVTGNGKSKGWWKKFRQISSKHVDLVVTDSQFNILCAIEIDDSSHLRRERKKRDELLNTVFRKANLPLLRVKPGREDELSPQIASIARRG